MQRALYSLEEREKERTFGHGSSPALGGAAHDRIHDDIVTPGATPHGLGASDEDCRD